MPCRVLVTPSTRRFTSSEVARAREYATKSRTEIQLFDLRDDGTARAFSLDFEDERTADRFTKQLRRSGQVLAEAPIAVAPIE